MIKKRHLTERCCMRCKKPDALTSLHTSPSPSSRASSDRAPPSSLRPGASVSIDPAWPLCRQKQNPGPVCLSLWPGTQQDSRRNFWHSSSTRVHPHRCYVLFGSLLALLYQGSAATSIATQYVRPQWGYVGNNTLYAVLRRVWSGREASARWGE